MPRSNLWEGGVQENVPTDSDRGKDAQKTFTCAHCNRIVIVPFKARPDEMGGLCMLELKPVCPGCHRIGVCHPFEKKLLQMEARGRLLAALG
jgi:hypothetical protein